MNAALVLIAALNLATALVLAATLALTPKETTMTTPTATARWLASLEPEYRRELLTFLKGLFRNDPQPQQPTGRLWFAICCDLVQLEGIEAEWREELDELDRGREI